MPSLKINYEKIKKEVFSLPLSQRLKLFNELKETDIKKIAMEAHKSLSKKLSEKKLSEKKLNNLIHASRKAKKNI